MRRAWITLSASLIVIALASVMRRGHAPVPRAPRPPPEVRITAPLPALLVGAVADPASAQVQIEQDLEHARRVFGPDAFVLFGGGPGVPFVHELGSADRVPAARRALTELFSPRSLAYAHRAPRVHVDAPATLETLDIALGEARAREPAASVLYVAGHGERGDRDGGAYVTLWGGERLTPGELASALREPTSREPLRVVVTACYGGAFADIVFDEADESLGPARRVHCGLFATTAEDEASGCDPDPDRARQEGFGIHFLSALEGRARDGAPLERADLDGDGTISLLEAHAHARVASASIDVPTLTSERFLRYAAPEASEAPPGRDLVEQFVIDSLSEALSLPTRRAAEGRLEELTRHLETQMDELSDAVLRADQAFEELRIALLEIVPFVDDPWHPRWASAIDARAGALLGVLERSDEAEAFRVAETLEANIGGGLSRSAAELARVRRLVRAHQNVALLGALEELGGDALERYLAIRQCERHAPRETPARR